MTLSWLQIARLGLVQAALGAIVVHYGIQMTRPHWGFASDRGGHRTRWTVGGMAMLGSARSARPWAPWCWKPASGPASCSRSPPTR